MRAMRGAEIGMIFQEPMTALNPLHTIGGQIDEVLRIHTRLGEAARRDRVLELLDRRASAGSRPACIALYPHQLSGGQRQRVMIAMALALESDAADRRRADHGARRHDPGADPAS